ncbi:cupin domain-containing protein [Yinghuangia seranimata]|uniref:cupin domain-containing protein n=1 Tax=Yinghuangia seranimata TaxID=408067 RepID=UPI00248C83F2|nr:cupin domain-containing protein [Yinghuangia seranimata]MDI2128356.1 cupin domain-containing protein [Yinghuangia seranimata]
MTAPITTPLGDTAPPPDAATGGILTGELLIEAYEGKSAVEHLLPQASDGQSVAPVKASWWCVAAGETSFPDQHEVQELWLIAAGSGVMTLGERELRVQRGQIVYIPTQVPHQVTADAEETLEAYSIWW